VRDSVLTILSPVRKQQQFFPDFANGAATPAPANDSLLRQAIAYYQCAGWMLKNGKYR
jgi:hypothetical protein